MRCGETFMVPPTSGPAVYLVAAGLIADHSGGDQSSATLLRFSRSRECVS